MELFRKCYHPCTQAILQHHFQDGRTNIRKLWLPTTRLEEKWCYKLPVRINLTSSETGQTTKHTKQQWHHERCEFVRQDIRWNEYHTATCILEKICRRGWWRMWQDVLTHKLQPRLLSGGEQCAWVLDGWRWLRVEIRPYCLRELSITHRA